MNPEQRDFLNLRVKPEAIGLTEVSFILGLHRDACGKLVEMEHLPVLAASPPGAGKWFRTRSVLQLASEEKWLAKAVRLVRERVKKKNDAQKAKRAAKGGGSDNPK